MVSLSGVFALLQHDLIHYGFLLITSLVQTNCPYVVVPLKGLEKWAETLLSHK